MTGTPALVRLALRRDRLLLPVWILLIVGAVAGTASAIAELYPGMAQRVALGVTIGSTPPCRRSPARSTTRPRSAG